MHQPHEIISHNTKTCCITTAGHNIKTFVHQHSNNNTMMVHVARKTNKALRPLIVATRMSFALLLVGALFCSFLFLVDMRETDLDRLDRVKSREVFRDRQMVRKVQKGKTTALEEVLAMNNIESSNSQYKHVFIMFSANWCIHSQEFMPKWSNFTMQASTQFLDVQTLKIECGDLSDLSSICPVLSYPTLRWYDKTANTEVDYPEERTVELLLEFARNMTGTTITTTNKTMALAVE